MLKVSDNVNGKFDIVLSDGYRSQLHTKGKATTKSDLDGRIQTLNKGGKTRDNHQQFNQRKLKNSKHDAKAPVSSTVKKSSRMAAQFDKMSIKESGRLTKNGYSNPQDKSSSKKTVDSSISGDNAAFVTKGDLASLLKALQTKMPLSDQDIANVTPAPEVMRHQDQSIDICKQNAKLDQNTEQNQNQLQLQSVVETPVSNTDTYQDSNVSNVSLEISKPTAMRSSFAIGAPGLVMNDPHSDKAARHKQWIKDLDQQIHAKREREQLIRKTESTDFISQTGIERTAVITNRTDNENVPVRTVGEASQQQEQMEKSTGRHGRGRGLMSMMMSTDETDKQRQKIVEHQKAIQQQVEDRRRQKQEERQRRIKEDASEEDRLARERAILQKQFEEELRKNKEKEEQARNRARILQEGISKAYESAQQLKRERRRNRVQTSVPEETNRDNIEQTLQGSSQNMPSNHAEDLPVTATDKLAMVPPLDLNGSHSPSDIRTKPNPITTKRLSDSTSKMKQDSSLQRDVKTSYSEPASLHQSHDLMHKWVVEDVGSSSFIDDKHHVYEKSDSVERFAMNGEVMIPFHRTASATLLSDTASSNDHTNGEKISVHQNSRHDQSRDRNAPKKGRLVPDVQPTRTSLLRSKTTSDEGKNKLSSRRRKEIAEPPQKSYQRKQPQQNMATAIIVHHDDSGIINKGTTSLGEDKMKITAPHPSSNYTPTAHQEKILEQLSALRKGLLMKDQELKLRVFHIDEHEIPT